MSPAIEQPTGAYAHPLDGPLAVCPHCKKILNQHGVVSIPANEISEEQRTAAASGDLFVPAPVEPPRLIRQPEQVLSGQASPSKAQGHIHPSHIPLAAPPEPVQHGQSNALAALDHPAVGGKMTIVVCCYGEEHENLHRRCLNSIVRTVPPSRMDLRIIANQVGLGSMNYFNSLPVTKIYPDYKARRKYDAMGQVFRDADTPIATKWVVWFDDDSYVRNAAWLTLVGQTIAAQDPKERVAMLGALMYHPLQHHDPKKDPRTWFRNAAWFKDKMFRNKQGRGVPNGDKIHFCVGGWWVLSTEAIRVCDIPDTRLSLSGGDITIGEMLWQNDFKMKALNGDKSIIHTSAAPPRGASPRNPRVKKMPWYA